MPKLAIVFGGILVALGLWGYFGARAEAPSPTALIPAGFGIALAACGAAGLNDAWRKHAMHVAAAVALLGLLAAGGRGLMKVSVLFDDQAHARPVLATLSMALVCLLYVGLSVRSFVQARRRQRAAAGA